MGPWRISAGASPVEAFAAAELARYLHRMTHEWPAMAGVPGRTIFVGIQAYREGTGKPRAHQMLRGLPDDGFVMRRVQEGLLLAGVTPRATLYAAYAWLEALGCRWYFPGEDGEAIPTMKVEQVRLDRVKDVTTRPAFTKRGVVADPTSDALDEWIAFAAKKRLTTVAAHSVCSLDHARSVAQARGIEIEAEAHLLEAGLCSSDPERMARYRASLREAIGRLPADMRDHFLWQADGDDRTCNCPADRGRSVTELTLAVYESLAETLRRERPAARLAFLIYLGTWRPPRKGTRLSDGLFGEFAPIQRCMAHAVGDARCPINAREIGPTLDAWTDILPFEEAQVLDYWLDSSLFGRGPFRENKGRIPHIGSVIREDARWYSRRGIRAATTFIVGVGGGYLSRWVTPPIFQYPALLWNPETDLATLNADFAATWLGVPDALHALEALAYVDTAGLEHGRPADGDAKLQEGRRALTALIADGPAEPFQNRMQRLLNEIEFRKAWHDVRRDDAWRT